MGKIAYDRRLSPEMILALQRQAELYPPEMDQISASLDQLREWYNRASRYWNADPPELDEIVAGQIPGPVGPIPVRYYFSASERPRPALIYLHGGGWIFGGLETHDQIMRRLALASGMAVVGVEYRLAPEWKFPVALEEARAVPEYLRAHGETHGLRPDRLALGGDSAGAHLALATALQMGARARDHLKMLILYYGHYGLRDSGSRRMYGSAADGLRPEDLAFYEEAYLRSPADRVDLRFDLFQNDPAGLPPVFLGAARLDPLLDDSLTCKALLDEVGVPCQLNLYEGVLHGFLHMSRLVPRAARALAEGGRALKAVLEA